MNSIFIAIISIIALYLGFKFYANKIEHLWDINPHQKTPAHTHHDGIDYIPAQHWTVLFGHNFASIAGAGPIIGPVIACAVWGWGAALIWIIVGTIFIGGVHDLSSLMSSIRQKGKSIAEVAEHVMGKKIKIIFASFLWLALILVVAVFAAITANTLEAEPRIVIPTFGLIFIAMIFGLMIYKWKVNQIVATTISLAALVLLIIMGFNYPIVINSPHAVSIWIALLLFYAYIASILPVNFLLQPRDYLSAFILFLGLGAGLLGILITHPTMKAPFFIGFNSSQGNLWPMMFVVVACGAVSGFHSLITSGTTSKQLPNEREAKIISYGGMVMEGVLATLAVICVSAGLYWWGGKEGLIFPEIMKNEGWIIAFSKGYGQITWPILGIFGSLIAMTTLNSFVLTTLDSSTRITRYISEELFGETFKIKLLKNRYLSTLLVILCSSVLAFGNWKILWPIFGAANQLVAALTLIIASTFLLSKNKPTKYTLYPGIFMLITCIVALFYLIYDFLLLNNYLLATISILLLGLTFTMIEETWKIFKKVKHLK